LEFKKEDVILKNCSRGLLQENGKVLFIEYKIEGETLYSLPGGTIEIGENLEECVIREFLEETGINIKTESLILLNEFISHHPKSVAESWKNGIHQIESIFRVRRNANEETVLTSQYFDAGMIGIKWLKPSELEKVTYYPEMPVKWFFLESQKDSNLYKTKRYK